MNSWQGIEVTVIEKGSNHRVSELKDRFYLAPEVNALLTANKYEIRLALLPRILWVVKGNKQLFLWNANLSLHDVLSILKEELTRLYYDLHNHDPFNYFTNNVYALRK
jgi:hypothetical protein